MTVTSIFGVQSGFNTTEFVESLIALQQKPLELKVAEREFQVEKLDLLQDLRNRLSTFKSLTRSLGTFDEANTITSTFAGTGGTPGLVGLSKTGVPALGTFNIDVTQLAQGEIAESTGAGGTSITSPSHIVMNNTISGGQFDLTVGGVTTSFFDADLPVGTTAQGVVDVINASGADLTASLVEIAPADYRIVLTANQTGAAQTITGDLIINGGANDVTFNNTLQVAQDSAFTVDGNPFSDATNTNTTAISGLALNLQAIGTGTITNTQDTSSLTAEIEDFVETYNELQQFIRDEAFFNPITLESGPLFGHYSIRDLQNTLSSTVTDQVITDSGTFQFLAQIGITTQDNGDLFINEAKLESSISSDVEGVIDLFGKNGVATDSNITFGGFTDNTSTGTFDVRVTAGVLEIRQGAEPFAAMVVVAGNVYTGAPGTAADGLTIEIDPTILGLPDATYGTVTIDSGAADQLTRELTFLADVTQNGPLLGDINTLTGTIEDLNETILKLDDRLQLFEEQIRQDFINLEIILGQLDSQRKAFEASTSSLGSLFSKK